jgi:hypothetical protein
MGHGDGKAAFPLFAAKIKYTPVFPAPWEYPANVVRQNPRRRRNNRGNNSVNPVLYRRLIIPVRPANSLILLVGAECEGGTLLLS